ncbi:winged helix-turn-helix transcriptional regulator [Candidatus Gracilibacteria bacterium]|nr:winged helix-turn-helix transcriptional regulator [Candidatus Gracilibacteria bacterium]
MDDIYIYDSVKDKYIQAMPVILPNKRIPFSKWFLGNSDFVMEIMRDKKFTGTDLRVLFGFVAMIDLNNYGYFSQKELADELNISQTEVSKSIKKLINAGLIIKGGLKRYYLNFMFAWRGNSSILREKVYDLKEKKALNNAFGTNHKIAFPDVKDYQAVLEIPEIPDFSDLEKK